MKNRPLFQDCPSFFAVIFHSLCSVLHLQFVHQNSNQSWFLFRRDPSIVYGPRTVLGLLMGLFGLTMNTLVILAISLVTLSSRISLLIIAIVLVLIRVTPYFVYRWLNRTNMMLIVGSMTNTVFVLVDLFLLWK